VTQLRTY